MATKNSSPVTDTHAPVLVRMPKEFKGQLQDQATIHDRTLTGEILKRLRDSFNEPPASGIAPALLLTNPPYGTNGPETVTVLEVKEKGPGDALSNIDRAMLDVFRSLPPEKQLALLSLFR